MNKKLKDLNKSRVKFFGFEWDTKQFLISLGTILGVLILLLALTLFGVELSWYGVFFGLGFLVALLLSTQLCKERDIHNEFPYTLIWFIFPLSILGARIYYLLFNGGIDSIMDILEFWKGGLAIYGGVIGGAIGLVIACLVYKINIIKMTDVVVPVLAIGQFFGRIGCIFGECCYGVEITNKALQWFPIAVEAHGDYFLATNFYESLLNLGLFFGLTILLRKVKITGINTCAYLFGYGLIRFVLESFRAQEQTLFVGNYPVSKIVSIVCILIGVIGICTLLFVNNRKTEKVSQTTETK
ncbi:MAG: prolipoprotein diacylglyceryl transferase [Clostridia bacterium]|nr:prolipoprotein diacylglyceryl transferase [Clostridia bacterium]